jgi:alpha-tubulin suppressor-like RCC1 family protein
VDQHTFVQAIGVSNAAAIACGRNTTAAIRSDGLVFACGDNAGGQLGVNSTASKLTFTQAVGISNAVTIGISVGNFTVALRSDGLVFACGVNSKGQLGDNSASTASKSTFVQALGISNAVAIACGYDHAAALRADGLVFTCGYNNKGQLGINSTVNKSSYVQASGISNAVAIACGKDYTIALRADGLIFGCGNNANGQLSINSTTDKSTFVQATGI